MTFEDWIAALNLDVIQDEFGYEEGEFTVYPDDWLPLFEKGLTPQQAFRRALASRDPEAAKLEEIVKQANVSLFGRTVALGFQSSEEAKAAYTALGAANTPEDAVVRLPIVERLRRYVTVADGKALVPVLPRDLRKAADTIEELVEALTRVVRVLDDYKHEMPDGLAVAAIANARDVLAKIGGDA